MKIPNFQILALNNNNNAKYLKPPITYKVTQRGCTLTVLTTGSTKAIKKFLSQLKLQNTQHQ